MAKRKVEVIRSARRRKTVEARREGATVVVRVPAQLSRGETKRWVDRMVDRIEETEAVVRATRDTNLEARARVLHERYFNGRPRFNNIRYVTNQRGRYGSCTPEDGTIRLSIALSDYPEWVRDYVIVHELAHLRVADHSSHFWQLVGRYPHAERARGFLIAKGLDE